MKAKLVISLLLAIYSSTESFVISNNSSVSTPVSNRNISKCDDTGLANITCMSNSEHEQLWGGFFKYYMVAIQNAVLLKTSVVLIAKEEMRKALNLPPPHPFGPFNRTIPTEEELAAAPTIEAYYDLKEPKMKHYSPESPFFLEHNFPPAISFLDKRIPATRALFKCRFAEIVEGDVDRKTVDRIISEFKKIQKKVNKAIKRMTYVDCSEDYTN